MQNKGIIGAVCGDIIGSAYEFHKTKDMNFKLFTPRSKFTDDTVMTCAVAEWLNTLMSSWSKSCTAMERNILTPDMEACSEGGWRTNGRSHTILLVMVQPCV